MQNFIEKMADSKDQAEVGLMEMQIRCVRLYYK